MRHIVIVALLQDAPLMRYLPFGIFSGIKRQSFPSDRTLDETIERLQHAAETQGKGFFWVVSGNKVVVRIKDDRNAKGISLGGLDMFGYYGRLETRDGKCVLRGAFRCDMFIEMQRTVMTILCAVGWLILLLIELAGWTSMTVQNRVGLSIACLLFPLFFWWISAMYFVPTQERMIRITRIVDEALSL